MRMFIKNVLHCNFRIELLVFLILSVETFSFIFAYQIFYTFDCQATDYPQICGLFGTLLLRGVVAFAALVLFFKARPKSYNNLSKNMGTERSSMLLIHFLGVALIFFPVVSIFFMSESDLGTKIILPWGLGSLLAAFGILFWYVDFRNWYAWVVEEKFIPIFVVGFAIMAPELSALGQGLWGLEALTNATFNSVSFVLFHLGEAPFSEHEVYRIGVGDFSVTVAEACSGLEGFVLISMFILIYGFMFQDELRFPHYWIILPIGILTSWIFNVIRISLLIWLGANVSPELAIEGFHSYAGWIAFTLISLAVLWILRFISWFQIHEEENTNPKIQQLKYDWNAARLFPFIVFMLSGVFVSAFFIIPEIGYPIRAIAMFAVLAFFWKLYWERIECSIDLVSIGAGLFVGAVWLALLPLGDPDDGNLALALADLGPIGFKAWVLTRIAGTVLMVPIIEELVFRGYIQAEIDKGDGKTRLLAIIISATLFALLHGRWMAAGIAGVVFSLTYLKRGKLVDAILAHMSANLVVAIWALIHGEWGAI